MTYSNCIIFALKLYFRRLRKGEFGYIAVRRSRLGKGPHFLYVDPKRKHWISFVPLDPKHKTLPPPLFKGKVKWGDE